MRFTKKGFSVDKDGINIPIFKTLGCFFILCLMLVVLFSILFFISYSAGWIGEASQVTKQEFGPKALLKKYKWFKDAAASLESKQANLKIYKSRVNQMKSDYGSVPRKDWARTDKEQMSVWMSEYAGIAASYNKLAAEYNAQMAKFNWKFCNAGDLPQGAEQPLPREFKPYQTTL